MAATVAALRTYLGLDPASTTDEDAMGAAVAAANDLVAVLRPDLTTARVTTARWIYAGTDASADPGAGNLQVEAWGGTSAWAVSETDADDDVHTFDALVPGTRYELRDATDNLVSTFVVQGQPADAGLYWEWTARLDAEVTLLPRAPAVGTAVYFGVPFAWPARADQAALVESARLYGRRGSVQGIAAFADLGVSLLPRLDPEVRSLLELGEYQPSVVA